MIKLNDVILYPTIFPDNTSQVWKIDESLFSDRRNVITWNFESEAEFLRVAQLKSLIDEVAGGSYKRLDMNYLPYARQDKDVSNTATFALHTFAKLINSLAFDKVTALDAHSIKATELITNFEDVFPREQIEVAIESVASPTGTPVPTGDMWKVLKRQPILLFPDKGAEIRYNHKFRQSSIIANKIRNQLTGHIESVDFEGHGASGPIRDSQGNKLFDAEQILMIDDICDGGMTFKLIAEELRRRGFTEIHLYVTHGIFSKGLETLRESGINRIFTKDGEIK